MTDSRKKEREISEVPSYTPAQNWADVPVKVSPNGLEDNERKNTHVTDGKMIRLQKRQASEVKECFTVHKTLLSY